MTDIRVRSAGADSYQVEVVDAASSSQHTVRATDADVRVYGGDKTAEELIVASFRFLLEREPKEAILASFDLPVIARYFPEYAARIGDYL